MNFITALTAMLAVYGAVLSTVLGILELRKQRRQVSIILELHEFAYAFNITITNTGHRPITIVAMTVVIGPDRGAVRQGQLRTENDLPPFPVTLTDGAYTRIGLSEGVSQDIAEQEDVVYISVYDAEGHEYTKYRRFTYNEKYGYYLPR